MNRNWRIGLSEAGKEADTDSMQRLLAPHWNLIEAAYGRQLDGPLRADPGST
jgi:hypothetical protein